MTMDPGYFRGLYKSSDDPWGMAERWYEARKYAVSVALLPRERYASAFEPGCSVGESFDLIVLSEVLYYFGDADLDAVLRLSVGALRPDGQLLAVHWRHEAPGYPRTGDSVHGTLAAHVGLVCLGRYRDPDFTAEVYARAGGDLRSVAQVEGIA